MSDEDAAIRAAANAPHGALTMAERAIYRAGVLAGMRRAAGVVYLDWSLREREKAADAIRAAADKLELEQEQR